MSIFALLNHQNVTIMKKSLLTTLVYLFSIVLAVSAPVDEQKARKLASDFLRSKMPATRSVSANLTRAVTGVVDGPDAAECGPDAEFATSRCCYQDCYVYRMCGFLYCSFGTDKSNF